MVGGRSGERRNSPVSAERPGRSSRTLASRNPLVPTVTASERSSLPHPVGELVHVEIVAPRLDLAVTDLEGPHDRQLERLVRELEAVHPLGHHDRTIGCDVDDAERDALDAWGTRADERGDVVRDGLPADDRRQRDIVVDGVVGEKCGQLGDPGIVAPRRAEPAHYLDRALHLVAPVADIAGALKDTYWHQPREREVGTPGCGRKHELAARGEGERYFGLVF